MLDIVVFGLRIAGTAAAAAVGWHLGKRTAEACCPVVEGAASVAANHIVVATVRAIATVRTALRRDGISQEAA